MKLEHPTSQYRIALIKAAISRKPMIIHEIATAVGVSVRYAKPYLDYMISQGQARAARWVEYGAHRYPVAEYCGKQGKNVPKPVAIDHPAMKRRLLKRMKEDERYERHCKRNNALRRKIKADPLVAALFGTTKKEGNYESDHDR